MVTIVIKSLISAPPSFLPYKLNLEFLALGIAMKEGKPKLQGSKHMFGNHTGNHTAALFLQPVV